GDRFRENLLMRGILPIIPPKSNRKAPVHPDYRRYKDRNRIERMFGKIEAATPHCYPLRQDRLVIRELSQPRSSTTMAEVFCQHGLVRLAHCLRQKAKCSAITGNPLLQSIGRCVRRRTSSHRGSRTGGAEGATKREEPSIALRCGD
ncbi:hypothetical protein QQ056_14755, partial [Oscillatoria laete-virens NRMC-F 0139]|nr:hypothetical protein [Oscillatoria laete-virens NRMC-F 0139]